MILRRSHQLSRREAHGSAEPAVIFPHVFVRVPAAEPQVHGSEFALAYAALPGGKSVQQAGVLLQRGEREPPHAVFFVIMHQVDFSHGGLQKILTHSELKSKTNYFICYNKIELFRQISHVILAKENKKERPLAQQEPAVPHTKAAEKGGNDINIIPYVFSSFKRL